MKELIKTFNIVTIGAMVLDAILILLGVFLVANPSVGTSSALILIGVILLVTGVYSIIKYIINPRSIFKLELIYGILSIIAGCLSIFKPFDVINFITIIVGIWIIITSLVKLTVAIELRKIGTTWYFDLVVSILTVIIGLLLVVNPFNNYVILSVYVGIMMIIYAGMDMVEQSFIRTRANDIIKLFK